MISLVSELEELRRKIDQLDYDLLKLLVNRLSLVKEIGNLKYREGLSVYQPERIKEVISTRCQWAKEDGISSAFVRELFELLISFSMEEEKW